MPHARNQKVFLETQGSVWSLAYTNTWRRILRRECCYPSFGCIRSSTSCTTWYPHSTETTVAYPMVFPSRGVLGRRHAHIDHIHLASLKYSEASLFSPRCWLASTHKILLNHTPIEVLKEIINVHSLTTWLIVGDKGVFPHVESEDRGEPG